MCNAHHLREATAAFEQDGHPWAGELIRFLNSAERETDNARRLGREGFPPRLLTKFDRWFDRIMAAGKKYCASLPAFEPARAGKRGPKKRRVAENFLRRLMKRKKETLLFLHDLSVPFTNNEAERNVRMITVKENISGCFRTLEGAEDHMTLSSVAITSRKQGLNVLEVFAGTAESFLAALRFE